MSDRAAPWARGMWPRLAVLAGLALVLQACTSPPRIGAGAAADPPGAALAVERRWLQSWFDGTPVFITQRSDGAVRVEVPLEFCFKAGSSRIQPALAAVLDKVAESLRRTPAARLALLAAPGDGAQASGLAAQRAARVRRHLLSRGVPALRLADPTVTTTAAVQLRMAVAPS